MTSVVAVCACGSSAVAAADILLNGRGERVCWYSERFDDSDSGAFTMSTFAGHASAENPVNAYQNTLPIESVLQTRRSRRRRLRPLLRSAFSLSGFADFLEHWKASRPRHSFFGALPWTGLVAGTGVLLSAILLRSAQHHEHNYEQMLEQAQRAGNVSLQMQCLEALADLNLENAQRSMELGILLTEHGNRQRGVALIRKAADGVSAGLADAHVWLARDLLSQGDRSALSFPEVERHLHSALTLSPAASETHVLLAEHYERAGESFLANKYRLSAARLDPRLYPAALLSVRKTRQKPDANQRLFQEAISTLENRLNLAPTDARLRTALAEVLVLNDQLSEAGRILNEPVEADDPDAIQRQLSHWNVAQAVALMNASPLNYDACIPLLKAALQQDAQNTGAIQLAEELERSGVIWPPQAFDSTIEQLAEMLEATPESNSVRISLSQLLSLAGRHAEAAEFLAPLQETSVSLKLRLMKSLLKSGDLQAGTSCGEALLTTLSVDPPSTSSILVKAECLLLLNRTDEALKLLRQQGQSFAPGDAPESLTILYSRACLEAATARLQSGNSAASADAASDPTELVDHEDENDPVFLLFIALACDATRYQALDRLTALSLASGPEARQAQTVIQTLRGSGEFTKEILSLTGINAIRMQQYDKAVGALEQARSCAATADPRILNNLALAMVRENPESGDRALELINQALVLLPGNPDLLSTRGEIHVARRQWKHALQDLTSSLELRPEDALVHRLLETTCRGLNADRQALIHRQIADRLEGRGQAEPVADNVHNPETAGRGQLQSTLSPAN